MSKSILFDATHVQTEKPTGVEIYARELLPRVSEKLLAKGYQVAWVDHTPVQSLPKGVRMVLSPHRAFWSQRVLPKLVQTEKPDLFFTPSGIPPLHVGVKTALTVHDISFVEFPESYDFAARFRLNKLLPKAVKEASAILVPSQYVSLALVDTWDVPGEKITVTHLGTSAITDGEGVIPKFIKNDSPFVLFLGRIERKKNLETVIHALEFAKGFNLVLAGGEGHGAGDVHAAVRSLPKEERNRVIFAGYVGNDERCWLYKHASAGLVPGLGEGFGIPVIECWQAGIVPVCARGGSLPEVGADAAVFPRGNEPHDWAKVLADVVDDPILRDVITRRGKERLKLFSWEKCADQTCEVFDQLLSAGK